MTAKSDYVKVADRVRVVEAAGGCDSHIEVCAGKDAWNALTRVWSPGYMLERDAEKIRDAIRLACKGVQERCAEEAAYGICGSRNPGEEPSHPHNQHAMQIAEDIRGLEP